MWWEEEQQLAQEDLARRAECDKLITAANALLDLVPEPAQQPEQLQQPAQPAQPEQPQPGASQQSEASQQPTLHPAAAAAAERVKQAALHEFRLADVNSGASMLRPLRRLLLARVGGQALHTVVVNWTTYDLSQQQQFFDAVLLVAESGCWDDIEEQLGVALSVI